jgi:ParB/RepB/Spo0J family partition protein
MTNPILISEIHLAQIRPGDNDRKNFNAVALQELADSIADNGLAQPIIVRPIWICLACETAYTEPTSHCQPCDNSEFVQQYQIVAGERRYRAFQLLGRNYIPAIIREDLDDETADAIMLAENVQRQDLNPLEEAAAYRKRMIRHDWSIAETARRASVSESKVRNRLSLLDLVPEAQHLVSHGNLPLGLAERMSVLDTNRQRIALAWLRDQPTLPSPRFFSSMVSQLHEQQIQETMFDLDSLLSAPVAASIEQCNGQLDQALPTITGLPDLPQKKGGLAAVLDAYIASLIETDTGREAARFLIDFWVKAMRANYCQMSIYESKTLVVVAQLNQIGNRTRARALEL